MKYIYIAGPMGPMGGGMLRVSEYLVQERINTGIYGTTEMVLLDTRGLGSAIKSPWALAKVMGRLLRSKFQGSLAGVHINMAERLSVYRKGVLLAFCRALGVPVVLHLHAAQMEKYYKSVSRFSQFVTRQVFLNSSHVVVLGSGARRFVIEEAGVSPAKVDVVMNGVPAPAWPRRTPSPDRRQKVLFMGNLWDRKGLSDLLESVALPVFDKARFELVVAGGGDVQPYIAKAKSLGISEAVTFTGWVNQSRAGELMADADVLVLPSYDEGLPLVILEAMANGVAVICTPVGEIPNVFTDGVEASFIEVGNPRGMADRISQVLSDPERLALLEINGKEAYNRHFSVRQFAQKIGDIHQKNFLLDQ